ncbi:hypothetical protein QR680_011994 [Steinernema hermaphroditum]|uniref:Uncharacterized protein n=1 Tax=Steinernema hermaphroditum TaxID=289476 RepID=A0AA39LZQ8_9BILA|nr:hypothetical protein QR680_011994 [Steinernema hermaphroditum]
MDNVPAVFCEHVVRCLPAQYRVSRLRHLDSRIWSEAGNQEKNHRPLCFSLLYVKKCNQWMYYFHRSMDTKALRLEDVVNAYPFVDFHIRSAWRIDSELMPFILSRMEHSATLHHYGCPMPKVNFRNRYFTKINIDTNEKGSLEFLDYSIKGGFLKELKIKDNVPEEKRHVLDNLYTEYMGSRGFGLLCLEDRHVVTAALFEKFFSYCYSTRSDNYRRLQGELGCSADEISGILEGYNLKVRKHMFKNNYRCQTVYMVMTITDINDRGHRFAIDCGFLF